MYSVLLRLLGKKGSDLFVRIYMFFGHTIRQIRRQLKICKNIVARAFRREKVFFLIGVPGHGNLGDQLIAFAEIEWLKTNYPDINLRVISHNQMIYDNKLRWLLSQIKTCDVLLFHGGGNIGDKYPTSEYLRRVLIEKCHKNKTLIFQQSVSFTDEANKKLTELSYAKNKNLTVLTRETGSYKTAKEMFTSANVMLFPDMTFFLFDKLFPRESFERDGVIFCLRKDGEMYYDAEQKKHMIEQIRNEYDVCFSDTHTGKAVAAAQREQELRTLIDKMAHYRVVVTDRFHGMVFSVLSGTPCVAMRSENHKIIDGIKWLEDVDYVYFAQSIEEIPELVKKAYASANIVRPDFSKHFQKMLEETRSIFDD